MSPTRSGTLIVDIETHSRHLLFSMPPEQYVRLSGYRWVGKESVLTTDLEELKAQIRKAKCVTGHNVWDFDLRAIFGTDSTEILEAVMNDGLVVYDTWVHAVLVNPAPYQYVNRHGKAATADSPEKMLAWFGLDEQAFQLGVQGKTDDLKELAHEFGDPSLPKKERIADGFGKIPLDDERYRAYLLGDLDASEEVGKALLKKGPLDAYALREQEIAARAAVISSNGLRLDQEAAQARVDELSARRAVVLSELEEKYEFPTEGKSPWATNPGKAAIMAALKDHGITPERRPDWPRTATGNPSLGGDALVSLTAGTPAEDLGQALAELKGQRSLAQLALDSVQPDGFVHPEITMLQRSGRWSTTKPGLTVWTSRGEGAVEKAYFVPDTDDEVLLEIDYSNADARGVAALSGDRKFAVRFQPGQDGHMINAIAAWGQAVVDTDPKGYRQKAKVPGHGWGYKIGPSKLALSTGMPQKEAKQFLDNMNKAFKDVCAWQDRETQHARRHGYVLNDWGRKLWVEKGREFTQAPALKGQNITREIVCDAILAMPIPVLKRVKANVHDAMIFSVPKKNFEACRDYLLKLMTTTFKPKRGGQTIEFPCDAGPPGENWYAAGH